MDSGQRTACGGSRGPAEGRLEALRRELLEAREAREALIRRTLAKEATTPPPGGSLIFAGTNVPGVEKNPVGLERVFLDGISSLQRRLGARPIGRLVVEGCDAAGRFALMVCPQNPVDAKRAAVAVEQSSPADRLLDFDVYDSSGRQIDRASLGLPARRCLLCGNPAVDCMRTGRHDISELASRARALLGTA